jgi:hypothetical protein
VAPPIVPATWVPWPLQSAAGVPGDTKSGPLVARATPAPSNSLWVKRMPESMTYAVTPSPVAW